MNLSLQCGQRLRYCSWNPTLLSYGITFPRFITSSALLLCCSPAPTKGKPTVQMGMQRVEPAAAAARRIHRLLVVGSSGNQRGLGYGNPLLARCQCPAEKCPSISKQVSTFSALHDKGRLCKRSSGRELSQFQPAGAALYSTFSQSAAHLAQQSTPDTIARKKKNEKKALEMASQRVKTQLRPIVYHCGVCEAICVTRILKDPYDRGVVIVRCMDCRSVNLISDQLGLFKEPGSMHKFLKERGIDPRDGLEKSFELTPENLAEIEQQRLSAAV